MIKVYNIRTLREYPGQFFHICPKCKAILANAESCSFMPQFSICRCDEEPSKEIRDIDLYI